jgi:hypothetical protein
MSVPLREQLKNDAFTTLNGAINNSQTTITVTTGSVFPSAGNFRIRVGDEIMLVTARSTNDLTVVRGQEGTTAASASNAADVIHVLTAPGLTRWAQDSHAIWSNSAAPPLGTLVDTDGKTLLTTSDFSWVNQGSTTVSDQNGTIIMDAPAASGENCRIQYRTAPSPTYSMIVAFQAANILESGCYPNFGLLARQSTSGKFYACALGGENGSHPFKHAVYKFNSATSYSGDLLSRKFTLLHGPYIWFKMTDDNTNLTFYVSIDGTNWIQTAQEARGTFLTLNGGVTGPDQIGWYINNQGSSLYRLLCRLCHWSTI